MISETKHIAELQFLEPNGYLTKFRTAKLGSVYRSRITKVVPIRQQLRLTRLQLEN